MIVNLYIEINRKDQKSEFERLAVLSKYLKANDMNFYDATDFDTCVSGLNQLSTLEEIKTAIEGGEQVYYENEGG